MKKYLLKFIGVIFVLALVLNISYTNGPENPPLHGASTIVQIHNS